MVRTIAVACCLALLGAPARASAQAPISRLTLPEALSLADTANPTVRAKEFEVQAVGAGEVTAALRPNPTANFLAEQFGSDNVATTQYTFSVGQPIELGGPKIKQARDTVEFAYKRGGVTLLDYLDAQLTYREKTLDYFRSLGNYHTALYQLEAAIGGPLEK